MSRCSCGTCAKCRGRSSAPQRLEPEQLRGLLRFAQQAVGFTVGTRAPSLLEQLEASRSNVLRIACKVCEPPAGMMLAPPGWAGIPTRTLVRFAGEHGAHGMTLEVQPSDEQIAAATAAGEVPPPMIFDVGARVGGMIGNMLAGARVAAIHGDLAKRMHPTGKGRPS